MQKNTNKNQPFKFKYLTISIAAAISTLSVSGCGGGSGNPAPSPTPPVPRAGVAVINDLPEVALVKEDADLSLQVHNNDMLAKEKYSQKMQAFELTDSQSNSIKIQQVHFPVISGAHFSISNTQDKNACCKTTDGSNCDVILSNNSNCEIDILASEDTPQKISQNVQVVTDQQVFNIPVNVNYVTEGSQVSLPTVGLMPAFNIIPGSHVSIVLQNKDNTKFINAITVSLPDWLNAIVKNPVLNHSLNIAPDATVTLSFDLGNDDKTINTLKAHLNDLNNNPTTKQISISAANVRTFFPAVSASLSPLSIPEEISFDKPQEQSLQIINSSSAPVLLTSVQSQLPAGMSVDIQKSTCKDKLSIQPAASCQLYLNAAEDTQGQGNVTFVYSENSHSFEGATSINVAKVAVEAQATQISIPDSGDKQTSVSVKNMGSFAWHPSVNLSDYVLSADPSTKTAPDGLSVLASKDTTNCLSGVAVASGKSCQLILDATSKLKSSIYDLTIKSVNNLAKDAVVTLTTTGVQVFVDSSYNAYPEVKRISIVNDSSDNTQFKVGQLDKFSIYNGTNADTAKGAWCTAETCPNACVGTDNTYSLDAGKTCYLYVHNNADTVIGADDRDVLSILLGSNDYKFSLQSQGVLYAGGQFDVAGQDKLSVNNIAMWNGQAWLALDKGVDNEVKTIKVAANGRVYAGGSFDKFIADNTPANKLGYWDGQTWQSLSGGVSGDKNSGVFAMDFAADGSLYLGGAFTAVNGKPTNNIVQWKDNQWYPLQNGVDGSVYSIATLTYSVEPHEKAIAVLIGGAFSVNTMGKLYDQNLTVWDNQKFEAGDPDQSLDADHEVRSILSGYNQKGDWFAAIGGAFSNINNVANTNYLVSIGSDGMMPYTAAGQSSQLKTVYAIASDAQHDLYIGGDLMKLDTLTLNHIAVISNGEWQALGNGVDGQVDTIVAQKINGITDVYAGGKFTHADAVATQGVARWDGSTWSAVGGGVNGTVDTIAEGNLVQITPA